MNFTLQKRVSSAVQRVASPKAAKSILKFVEDDLVLPILGVTARSKVSATTDGKFVYLNVGRRDFEFYAKSGRLAGAGTFLG
jgi:hypothetical protein